MPPMYELLMFEFFLIGWCCRSWWFGGCGWDGLVTLWWYIDCLTGLLRCLVWDASSLSPALMLHLLHRIWLGKKGNPLWIGVFISQRSSCWKMLFHGLQLCQSWLCHRYWVLVIIHRIVMFLYNSLVELWCGLKFCEWIVASCAFLAHSCVVL